MNTHEKAGAETASHERPLEIYTLGRFEVRSAKAPPNQSRKTQHKPLQMLKAIVAMGGRNVSKESLIDILWPDSEGDTASQSFATTLHRLRKLLGNKDFIRLQDNIVSLAPDLCWLDTWAFESQLDDATGNPSENPHSLEKAVSLYRGHFLPADDGAPWTASTRERLRSKFLRGVEKLCNYWKDNGDMARAVECYQKALEVDDLSEHLYRNLMTCYGEQGQKADAAAVYNRCCRVLNASLGVNPSDQTETVYRSIVSD